MNHPDPLTLNQVAAEAGVSRSTVKRRLSDLENAGAYRLPSGEWRVPRDALTVFEGGSRGSSSEPRDPGVNEPRDPREPPPDEPRDPPPATASMDDADGARDELVVARLEAAEWRARAEERAERITDLTRRAEAAEARLDAMITSQTALALTLKEHQQLAAVSTASPEPERGRPQDSQAPTPQTTPTPSPAESREPDRAASGQPVRLGERISRWFGRRG